jgi:site-specific recombinase XerD
MTVVSIRKIGLHHLAFYRAFFEGSLDLREVAQRHLETGTDISSARQTLRMVEDALVATAVRSGQTDAAQWLVLPASAYRGNAMRVLSPRPTKSSPRSPSLEEWAREFDPNAVYGEAELIEEYKLAFASELEAQKRASSWKVVLAAPSGIDADVLARRIQVINELAAQVVTRPQADDLLGAWLDPKVVARLSAVNIATVAQLVEFANEHGHRWHRLVPKLGEKTAAKLIKWLADDTANGQVVGLSDYARTPRTLNSTTAWHRAQRWCVPDVDGSHGGAASLSGAHGINRTPPEQDKSQLRNDKEAIEAWIRVKPAAHTQIAYRKEAERLLLWSIFARGKPFSSLSTDDIREYLDFLKCPPPEWCSTKRYPRFHPNWRPFIRPENVEAGSAQLTDRSLKQARAVLASLFQWLVDQTYLTYNPMKGLAPLRLTAPIQVDHSFTKAQWRYVVQYLKDHPPLEARDARARFLITFAYGTGLRRDELARARVSNLKRADFEDESLSDAWELVIVGKGDKPRSIPVPRVAMKALSDYLLSRGLSPDVSANPPHTPLLANVKHQKRGVSGKTVYVEVKHLLDRIAGTLEADSYAASRFRQASTHWLRHTYGTHAHGGARLNTVQQNMGHASLATTTLYSKAENADRWREMDAFMDKGFHRCVVPK